jgi:hypothetical protein
VKGGLQSAHNKCKQKEKRARPESCEFMATLTYVEGGVFGSSQIAEMDKLRGPRIRDSIVTIVNMDGQSGREFTKPRSLLLRKTKIQFVLHKIPRYHRIDPAYNDQSTVI